MTRKSPAELKKQELEDRYTLLIKQHANACRQRDTATNAADQPKLQGQVDDLWAQICDVDTQLQQLERSLPGATVRQRQQQCDDALPKIDFSEAWRAFTAIYDKHVNRREGGAALLLAPDFRTMCADLFVRRLYDWLQDDLGYNKVRRVPVGISDFSQLTPDLFLRRLGNDFNVSMDGADANSAAQVRAVTDKLCAVLERGHLLLIEVTIDADFYCHERFVGWLLDSFWPSLRASLNAAAQERTYIKCLLVLAVDPPLPDVPPLRERYCPLQEFDPVQRPLARLPLEAWHEKDIEKWLVHHSGLAAHWSATELNNTVSQIYVASRKGEPMRVKAVLQELFK